MNNINQYRKSFVKPKDDYNFKSQSSRQNLTLKTSKTPNYSNMQTHD